MSDVPPPPGLPAYGPPPSRQNGFGVAALVLGIVGIPLAFACYTGTICSILAIVFGAVGLSQAKRGRADNRGMAVAGLVLGIVGLAIVVALAAVIVIGLSLDSTYDSP